MLVYRALSQHKSLTLSCFMDNLFTLFKKYFFLKNIWAAIFGSAGALSILVLLLRIANS